ncbi:MAG: 3-dehydroquinate dehydratase [Firmicutes bacterium]|nr:3-dehydroquinate dehydratase [Bacillota bacterium]MCL1954134.1 3-dehydroquinate dehydratase [Bacillota bacterium]
MTVLIVNGPNMQNLDKRKLYNASYQQLIERTTTIARELGIDLDFFVSDIEGEIVSTIANCQCDAIIINAAAYSHYSIAIRDALEIFDGKKIEVHMTNIYKREQFRHQSVVSPVVDGTISGFGLESYVLALKSLKVV